MTLPCKTVPEGDLQWTAESDAQEDAWQLLSARNTEFDNAEIPRDWPKTVTAVEPEAAGLVSSMEETEGPS